VSARRGTTAGALLILALLTGACGGSDQDPQVRLYAAQRAYWQVLRAQERLDIYPNRSLAEDCVERYLAVARECPVAELPRPLPAEEREGAPVRLARVGAMAALGAAGIQWELGEREVAIASLRGSLREDLPLGALTERRLRATLAGYLRERKRPREALAVYASLLTPLGPGLVAGDAAYPDAELLAVPAQMAELALAAGDSALAAETGSLLGSVFARVARDYAGEEPGFQGLLAWADIATRLGRWAEAEAALGTLARDYPTRESWRAELQRARLLAEHLGRPAEAEALLVRLAAGVGEEAVAGGTEYLRFLLARGRLAEVPPQLERLRRLAKRREDRAELLYLWGAYEMRLGVWDRARQRWGEAAAELPYTPFGMECQLAVARTWAERGESRFAAVALDRLFEACRRNTRQAPGSELAGVTLALEARADSLLGTLPASDAAVSGLRARRHPVREGS
jgi:tetratricopeptide (TPR) repeat protein